MDVTINIDHLSPIIRFPFIIVYSLSLCLSLSGLEHYIRELADICLPHVVLHSVDGAGQEKVRHAHVTLYGGVWEPGNCAAVYLEL